MANGKRMTKAHESALRQLAKIDGSEVYYLRVETGTTLGNRLQELKDAGLVTLKEIEPAYVLVNLGTPETSELTVERGSDEDATCAALFNPPFQMAALVRFEGTSRTYSLHAPIRSAEIQVKDGSKQWGVVQRLRTSPFKCATIVRAVPEYRTYRMNDAGRAALMDLT